jgi:hypothetical protein
MTLNKRKITQHAISQNFFSPRKTSIIPIHYMKLF